MFFGGFKVSFSNVVAETFDLDFDLEAPRGQKNSLGLNVDKECLGLGLGNFKTFL